MVNDLAVVALSRSDWEFIKLVLSDLGAERENMAFPWTDGQVAEAEGIVAQIREQTRREVQA